MSSSHTDAQFQKFSSWGGGGGSTSIWQKKNSDSVVCLFLIFAFFLVLGLFYGSQMVNFKEKYHFSRFRRGSKFFQGWGGGGGQLLILYRNPNNLWFSRGVRTPWPLPSGSALGCDLFSFPVRKMMRSPLGLHMCSFSCNSVVCFQSSPAIKSFLELTAWLLPGLSNILCNSSLHSSITQ